MIRSSSPAIPLRVIRGNREGVAKVQVWYKVPDEGLFRLWMGQAGYNGASLSESVGCTRQAISLLAKGERSCRPDLADRIAEALGKPRDAIFLRLVSRTALKSSTITPKKAA